MIAITARCQTCSWKWKPRKAEGPDRDHERARNAAAVHRRQHPRHIVEAKRVEKTETRRGGHFRFVDIEITQRAMG